MRAIVLMLAAALCCGSVHAAVPRQINYQGYLTSPGGAPVNATVQMVLKLYDVAAAGTALHSETQSVVVANGVFNVLLGAQPANLLVLPFDVPYWLGVKVEADAEMAPRQPVAANAYAIRAASTEALAPTAAVPGAQLANASVTAAKLASNGCSGGQILKYNGSAWACAADDSGGVAGGLSGQVLVGTGGTPAWSDSATLNGNLVLANPSTATTGNIMKGSSRFIHGVGFANTFIGEDSGNLTITGSSNTVAGANALGSLTSGGSNTASGYFALFGNTSGSYNIALGTGAGGGLTTGDFNIDIGNAGVAGESATIRLGGSSQTRTFVAGIRGVTPGNADALPVVIDSNGQLGTGAAGTVPGTFQWQVVAGTSQQAQSNTGYVANNAAQVTVTLPTAPNVGDTVRVSGAGGGGWKIAQNALQSVSGSYFGLAFVDQWVPRDSVRGWSSMASSADGSKLVAAVSGPGGLLYTSIDYGASWAPRESVRNWLSVASSADGSNLVAVAYFDHPYTSIDSGVTWTQRDAANARYWSSVASSSDGSKLVAAEGSNGFVYTSIDFGANWTQRASSGGRLWQSVASSADGSKLVAVAYNDNLYTSSDSGVTWTARDSIRYWKAVASSADGSKLVAAAEGAGGQLFTSTDSGATWTPRESSRNWVSLASSTDGSRLVAAAGNAQIYTSSDFGVAWTARETSRQWAAVASSADGTRVVAAATGIGPGGGGLIYTSVPVVNSLAASTTAGATGYLTGAQRAAIELQYIGGGQFISLSYVGTIGSH
ncbi:MAG: hypothetical protein IPO58_22930 [Betaproteobacteria bacterium]|nr:hypothetical protein [Betaproteobacteria bacterium]